MDTVINKNNLQSIDNSIVIPALQLKRSKWLFYSLCFYLFSQIFTIPILPIGAWATWLTLSDFGTVLLILTFLLNWRYKKPSASNANTKIFLMLIAVLLVSILSYISYLSNLIDQNAIGIRLGSYQLYRLVQFLCIFWITAQIPLTLERINLLKKIVNLVLILVCLSILLTFAAIIPLGALTAHLPQSKDIAGAWSNYASVGKFGGRGWGTIGYNHAYVAAQVTMLVSLRIHLGLEKQVVLDFLLLLLSIVTCFITESRAGFFGMLIFAAVYMLKKPAYTGIVATILVLFISIAAGASLSALDSVNLESSEGSILERQTSLLDAGNAENLSGRDNIWEEKVNFLNQEPVRWLVGTGFGSAWDNGVDGGNAHMLFLHIILENGMVGLLIFGLLFSQICYLLHRYESGVKAIYWITIALLVTSFTQETFYPVIAFGHYLGFYLCSVAIALRRNVNIMLLNSN